MASPAWSPGNWALGAALALALWGCKGDEAVVVRGDPALKRNLGVLFYQGTPFSGILLEKEQGKVVARTPFFQGREQGRAVGYYKNGGKKFERIYRAGHKAGTHYGYWENGKIQFVYRYVADVFHGEQLAFYPNGSRFEVRHYKDGYEEGLQSSWNAEGRLVENYTFKNGRRYGIVGRSDCVTVHK